MRLLAFHCGGEIVADPSTGARSTAPYFFYAVEHPAGVVLFDSGCHPRLINDPLGHLGPVAASEVELVLAAGDDAASKLRTAGISPDRVAHVVQSHLHFDHCGGLALFPDAEVHVQQAELDLIADPPAQQLTIYAPRDYEHAPRWVAHDGDADLFGDGTLVMVPTPGHTAGHQSLLVRLGGRAIILAADAAYRPSQFEERTLSSVYTDAAAMLASYERLEAMRAEESAAIVFTHDRDWATNVRVAPDAWYD